MIDMLKRDEIQVLRRAEHTRSETATLSGVAEKTARRIAAADRITNVDNAAERARRQVGRPSKAEAYRQVLVQALTEDPSLRSLVTVLIGPRRSRFTNQRGTEVRLGGLERSPRASTGSPATHQPSISDYETSRCTAGELMAWHLLQVAHGRLP
jgi:hypothetical protein